MINEATILGADIKAVESYMDNKLEEYNLAHSDSPVLLEGIVSVSPFEEFSGLKKFPEHFVRLACYFSSIYCMKLLDTRRRNCPCQARGNE